MKDFPDFMKHPANRIDRKMQYTPGIEGYVFDGVDGSQMCIWTYAETSESKEHTHDYDEYIVVVKGMYTVFMDGNRVPLKPGDEHVVPKGTPHRGEVVAGTRAIYAFGGRRAQRATKDR